ncbi:MAG: class II aldolase/adducin family protein [Acidimicrobiales bacterium]
MTRPNGAPLDEVRVAVLAAAKAMHARGLVEGTAGNVSGRVDDGTVVVTPSSLGYEEMTLDDLVVVDLDGNVVSGTRSATSEKGVHLATFAAYPEVGGVVHCHAVHASMYAVSHRPIPAAIDEFVVYIGGDVPVGEYQPSGSEALSTEVARHLHDRSAVLMANHGLVTIGKSVDDALHSALVVEHNAKIMWGAQQLGGVVGLPHKTIRDFTGVYGYVRGQTWVTDA